MLQNFFFGNISQNANFRYLQLLKTNPYVNNVPSTVILLFEDFVDLHNFW